MVLAVRWYLHFGLSYRDVEELPRHRKEASMVSPRPHRFPFDDDDRPSGSVQPLSQADLQAILAHLGDDPDELLADTIGDRPVVAMRVRASVGRPAAPLKPSGGSCGRPSGPPGPGPCPGGSPPSSPSLPVAESSAAYWHPG
jgi:hypothetical protein